jgi:hypothetical protein
MLAVATAGIGLGWIAHAGRVLREEDDFGGAILLVEVLFGATVLLPIVLAIGFVKQLVRKGNAYLARLRRSDTPDTCPWLLSEPDPPETK